MGCAGNKSGIRLRLGKAMPKFRIKVYYSTGDTFSTEEKEEYLDPTWESEAVADENAQRIEDHYQFYEAKSDRRYFWDRKENKRKDKLAEDAPKQVWWSGSDYSLMLKLD